MRARRGRPGSRIRTRAVGRGWSTSRPSRRRCARRSRRPRCACSRRRCAWSSARSGARGKGDVLAVGAAGGHDGGQAHGRPDPALPSGAARRLRPSTSRSTARCPACASRRRARAVDRTGVEMEAMVAVAVAALTVYDMVKGAERGVEIRGVRLEEKRRRQVGFVVAPGRARNLLPSAGHLNKQTRINRTCRFPPAPRSPSSAPAPPATPPRSTPRAPTSNRSCSRAAAPRSSRSRSPAAS